ncbi:hypothetical protein CcaverHIS002_0303140 [Cutaneotrichosporon cavernicola]|nr:hypothetical protein CcaverHIS002_0303140 [Cutaneotrichosporon cavernicola]
MRSRSAKKWFIITLAAVASICFPISTNIFVPAIPMLVDTFVVSPEKINLTITMSMVSQGITSALWGAPRRHVGPAASVHPDGRDLRARVHRHRCASDRRVLAAPLYANCASLGSKCDDYPLLFNFTRFLIGAAFVGTVQIINREVGAG